MTNIWQPGTTYAPGATVIPTVQPLTVTTSPANPDFAQGLDGWNARPGWSASPSGGVVDNGPCCLLGNHAGSDILIVNTNQVPVTVGQSITATCQVEQGPASAGDAEACVSLFWYDVTKTLLSRSDGSVVSSSAGTPWKPSTVTAVAPASTVFAAIGAKGKNVANKGPLKVDAFSWTYQYAAGSNPLVYTATQATPGKSAATEPAWPTTAGVPVTDNEVTWEGGDMTSVTWTASRLLESGATEPTWPTTVGADVVDNTVDWVVTVPRITDPNCPPSKYVAIVASKIYAGDNDIVRFSATANPLDWTTQDDAGFLPFGLQNYGSNPITAMGLYRSNLVAFNSQGQQMWQVDEDPANAALLDALPIGSTQHQALSPVSNDLFFLASQGVRTMGISSGSNNLAAGDVGMPIDPLVQAAMLQAIDSGFPPLATYYPSTGQYWLAFPGYPDDLFF